MQEARFYEKLAENTVQCRLCPHYCKIREGGRGKCRTRQNEQGTLHTLVYGQPAAIGLDPIEKKPLYHYLPGTRSLSFGTRGCNLTCANCHNYELSQSLPAAGRVTGATPEEIVATALTSRAKSIAFTYNEPTVFAEFAIAVMAEAHLKGLRNIWIGNGYTSPEAWPEISSELDAANIDLKSFSDDFYRRNCGARLAPVLESLKFLKKKEVWLEVTTLLIPGENDGPDELASLAEWINNELGRDTPWHLSRFSADISWRLRDRISTAEADMDRALDIGIKAGLRYVYPGNLSGHAREHTYCPACRRLVIRRRGFTVERLDNNGLCPACGFKLPIILS